MNWTEFKAAILPTMEELLLHNHPTTIGWKWNNTAIRHLTWNSEAPNPFTQIIQELLPQLSPELQTEIRKCDRFDEYQDLNPTEQVEKILLDISAAMINDFSDVATTYYMQEDAKWDLQYLDDAPKLSDFEMDEEKYDQALEEWEAEFDQLKSRLNDATEDFERTYDQFESQWAQLAISQFYNSRYDTNETKMERSR